MSAVTLLLTHPMPIEAMNRLQTSSCAVFGFILGAFLASKIDAQFHGKHRGKLAVTSFVRGIIFALMAVWVYNITWANKAMLAVIVVVSQTLQGRCREGNKHTYHDSDDFTACHQHGHSGGQCQ